MQPVLKELKTKVEYVQSYVDELQYFKKHKESMQPTVNELNVQDKSKEGFVVWKTKKLPYRVHIYKYIENKNKLKNGKNLK